MRDRRRAFWILVPLLFTLSCSEKKQLSPEQYFDQANTDFRNGAFNLAAEGYRDLLDQHPFSDYTEEAELRIAHAQYLDEDYIAAVVSFSDFQRRHPTSPHLPFVGYHLGMCYVKQMGTIDRDQTAAQSALAYFTALINQYPESPFTELGRAELARCRDSLAAHELYVAHFYQRRGNLRASELRLLMMAAEYGDTPSAADGLLQLARNYSDANNPELTTLACRALRQLHPGSEQTRKSYSLIDEQTDAKLPPTSDPVDLMLIANGRHRPAPNYALPEIPRARESRPGAGPGPAMPPMDPFGRGAVGY